jgi:hypothetical protein
MNLAERRAVQEFQTLQFPDLQKKVTEAAGYELPVEVNWETLAAERESKLYAESWPKIYFEPLITALKEVGRDDMGKEALKEKLNKVVIQNTQGCYYADRWAAFDEGVLTLDHESVKNAEDVEEREKSLVALLEAKL